MPPPTPGAGRPPKYCKRSCRERMYEARQRTGELTDVESELRVTRAQRDDLADQLAIIRATATDLDLAMTESAEFGEVADTGDTATLRRQVERLLSEIHR